MTQNVCSAYHRAGRPHRWYAAHTPCAQHTIVEGTRTDGMLRIPRVQADAASVAISMPSWRAPAPMVCCAYPVHSAYHRGEHPHRWYAAHTPGAGQCTIEEVYHRGRPLRRRHAAHTSGAGRAGQPGQSSRPARQSASQPNQQPASPPSQQPVCPLALTSYPTLLSQCTPLLSQCTLVIDGSSSLRPLPASPVASNPFPHPSPPPNPPPHSYPRLRGVTYF